MNKCLVFDKRLDVADLKPRSLLCVGGTRSGKSDFALHYAQNVQGPKTFIATMQKSFAAPQENSEQGNSAGQQKESTDKEMQKGISYKYSVTSIDKNGIESAPTQEIELSIEAQK